MNEHENGIDLVDFVNILLRHKWLILIGTAVFVVLAAAVSVIVPKQYSSNMILELAIAEGQPVEDNYLVEQVINGQSFLAAVQDRTKTNGHVIHVTAQTDKGKSTTMISIQVTADSPETAVNGAKSVASLIAERQSVYLDERMKIWKDYAEELKKKIQDTGEQIGVIHQSISKLLGASNAPAAALVMQTQLEQKESEQLDCLRELRDVNIELSTARSRNVRIVSPATFPSSPSRPNFRLNISVAFITGVFISVLLVFFIEYVRRARMKIR